MPLVRSVALLALIALVSPAQDLAGPKAFVGDWAGKVADRLDMVFHIESTASGLTLKLDVPAQGAKGIPAASVEVDGNSLVVKWNQPRAQYRGQLSADGTIIKGFWVQGGPAPLDLKRLAEGEAAGPKRPQTPKGPFPYRSEAFTVSHTDETGPVTLAATLTLPQGDGPFPAAILITGSGQQDRDETIAGHKPFLVLADHLSRRGLAVLRLDDRGIGGSTGEVANATSAHFANDIAAALARLAAHESIDPKRIGLMGHSEGGLIAPIVASAVPGQVAFIVSLAGCGVSGRDILERQTRALLATTAMPEAMVTQRMAFNHEVWQSVIDTPVGPELDKKLTAAAARFYETLTSAEKRALSLDAFTSRTIGQSGRPWFRFFLSNDPAKWWSKVTCPVLVLNGTKDLQVLHDQNVPAIQAALAKAGNEQVTSRVFDDLNHLFQKATTGSSAEYGQIETTIEPVVLETIASWTLATVRD